MKKISKVIIIMIICILTSGCTNFIDFIRDNLGNHMNRDNTIIIFYRDDCKYCNRLSEYLDSQDESIKNQLKIKKYNIKELENRDLFNQKIEELGLSSSDAAVPFIIIGDNYFIGFKKENFNEFIYENLNIKLAEKKVNAPNGYQIYNYETNMIDTYADSFVAGNYVNIFVLYIDSENSYVSKYFENVLITETELNSSSIKMNLALNNVDFNRINQIEKSQGVSMMVLPTTAADIFEEIETITYITKEEIDNYIK